MVYSIYKFVRTKKFKEEMELNLQSESTYHKVRMSLLITGIIRS